MNHRLKMSQTWCTNESFVQDHVRRTLRCGLCTKRVLMKPVHCVGGELVGHRFPQHKTKPKPVKRAKGDRQGSRSRRG
jgi:hypothetical protein